MYALCTIIDRARRNGLSLRDVDPAAVAKPELRRLRVVSHLVIEQIARDSHQGPSREIPGVQVGFALVDTTVLRDLQKEGSGGPATSGGARQACLRAWRD